MFDAVNGIPLFQNALERFYDGAADPMTLDIVRSWTD
jgi:hypothetical protein